MKKHIKLLLGMSTSLILALPNISMNISNNVNTVEKEESEIKKFLVDSEIGRLSRLSGEPQKIRFLKEIKDVKNNIFLLIATEKMFSIVDANSYVSSEIHYEKLNDEVLKLDLTYDRSFGLLRQKDKNTFVSVNNGNEISRTMLLEVYKPVELNDINEFRKNQLIKRENEIKYSQFKSKEADINFDLNRTNYNYDGRFRVSYTVPYAWWFATRNNYESSAYIDLGYEGKTGMIGLCEYVALSQLLLYNHLFIDGTIFTDDQYAKFIKDPDQTSIKYWEDTSPVFKNIWPWEQFKNCLTYTLYELADKSLNLHTSNYYWYMFDKFNQKEPKSWQSYGKYGGYYRAWESIKNGTPVILGIAPYKHWYNHAYLMYGYDDASDMFLGSMCWGSEKSNTILYSYYNGAHGSYYYTIKNTKPEYNRTQPRVFKYKDKLYTGAEINSFILNKEGLK
ncbi:putative cysteine peptidase [Mycoplasma sp. SK341A]|uniref:putative cysteine peptidase n=1 Tax=unclassified Mycoplasma TaxID=2683645 RepID=UPI003AAF5451